MSKSAKAMVILWSLFMVAFGGISIYWQLIDDNPPIVIHSLGIGDEQDLCLDFTKYTNAVVEDMRLTYVSESGVSYFREIHPTYLPPGDYVRSISLDMDGLPPGKYLLRISITYDVNPMKTRTVWHELENVTITP